MFDISASEFTVVDVFTLSRTNDQSPGVSRGRSITSISTRLSGFSDIVLRDKTLRADSECCLLIPRGVPFTHIYREEKAIAIHLDFTKNPPSEAELIYSQSPRVKEIFLSVYEHFSLKTPGYICKCKSLIYELFYILTKASCERPNHKLDASMKYLYDNCYRPDFDLKKMICASGLSEAYFRRLFREVYDCSAVDFVSQLRVDRAKSLLESTDNTITEIAVRCGFSDDKYFFRVFKERTGRTPREYREGK